MKNGPFTELAVAQKKAVLPTILSIGLVVILYLSYAVGSMFDIWKVETLRLLSFFANRLIFIPVLFFVFYLATQYVVKKLLTQEIEELAQIICKAYVAALQTTNSSNESRSALVDGVLVTIGEAGEVFVRMSDAHCLSDSLGLAADYAAVLISDVKKEEIPVPREFTVIVILDSYWRGDPDVLRLRGE